MARRVLFVAYFYPPLANSGTQRPLKLANYLPDFGWEPLVLTVDSPPDAQFDQKLLREVRPGTRITRVKMLSDVVGTAVGRPFSAFSAEDDISSAISWRMRQSFQWPDLYALWRPTAVRAGLRMFREIGFDAVWATGFPWSSLLVGRDISIRTGVPLVADFRDPWTGDDIFDPSADAEFSAHRRLERSVLAQAAAVTSPSDIQTEELRQLASEMKGKHFVTITNGFDRQDAAAAEVPDLVRRGRLRIVYTGVWKPGINLETLYEAVRLLAASGFTPRDLEIVAAGFAPGQATRYGIEDFVVELGRVSHAAALGLMRTGDILFLPSPEGVWRRMCIPGKLYEYAAAGRPILALSDPQTAVDALLNEIGGSLVVPPDDPDALARTIASVVRQEVFFPPFKRDQIDRYDRKFLARKLAELLYNVTGSPAETLTELKPATQSC